MAATTFAQIYAASEKEFNRELIRHNFLEDDGGANLIGLESVSGTEFVQKQRDPQDTAKWGALRESFDVNALTFSQYSGWLNRIMDEVGLNLPELAALKDGQKILDLFDEHRLALIESVSTKFRDTWLNGNPATVTVGATLQGQGITAVESGPRTIQFADAHGHASGTVTSRLHTLKWVQSTKTLSWKRYGDTSYGDGVVVSADKDHRVALFNEDGTSWIWVNLTYATLAAETNFETDGSTEAENLKFTPSLEMTGAATLTHPTHRFFGNLSQTDPTAAGDSIDLDAMAKMGRILKKYARKYGGYAAAMMSGDMFDYVTSAQRSAKQYTLNEFDIMGNTFEAPRFPGGIPMLENDQLSYAVEGRKAHDGSTPVERIVGVIFGTKNTGFHCRYASTAGVQPDLGLPQLASMGPVDTGHEENVSLPWTFYIVPPDKDTEMLYPRATMLVEGASPYFGAVVTLDDILLA